MPADYRPPCAPFTGPGTVNKYQNIDGAQCLVNMRDPRGLVHGEGRDLWRNHSNPYQFDKAEWRQAHEWQKSLEQGRLEKVLEQEQMERATAAGTSTSRSTRSASVSARSQRSGRSSSRSRRGDQSARPGMRMRCHSQNERNFVHFLPREIPGYMGYVPGIVSENIFGRKQGDMWRVARATQGDFSGPAIGPQFEDLKFEGGLLGKLPRPRRYDRASVLL